MKLFRPFVTLAFLALPSLVQAQIATLRRSFRERQGGYGTIAGRTVLASPTAAFSRMN